MLDAQGTKSSTLRFSIYLRCQFAMKIHLFSIPFISLGSSRFFEYSYESGFTDDPTASDCSGIISTALFKF